VEKRHKRQHGYPSSQFSVPIITLLL